MKNLLNVMLDDWNIHSKFANEAEILCRNYAVATKITTMYAGKIVSFIIKYLKILT